MTLFLSYLLGARVYGQDGMQVGTLADFIIRQVADRLPEVTGVVMRRQGRKIYLPVADVAAVEQNCVRLDVPERALPSAPPDDDSLHLKRDILDAQVVDTSGAKVVRVNDILLTQTREGLLVSGLDIGTWGLMRRLGVASSFAAFVHITKLKVPEGVVPWDTTEPIDKDPTRVHLKTTQDRLVRMHPADLADVIEEMGHAQRGRLLEQLTDEQLADVIEESDPAMQSAILHDLTPERAADVLEEMEPDEAADLLGELPRSEADAFIGLMEPEEAAEVQQLLTYDDETAGALMTTSYLAVPEDMTVAEALDWFREDRPDAEVVAYFYLHDADGLLTGVVSSRRIMLERDQSVAMTYLSGDSLYTVQVDAATRDVVDLITRYHLTAVPVVEDGGRLVGVISVHDVLEHVRPPREG